STKTIHEHREWSGVGDFWISITVHVDFAVVVFNLHYRAFLNEQSGEFDRLGQITAAVATQVQDESLNSLLLQLLNQTRHVLGRRAAFRIRIAFVAFVIKCRKGDHAELLVNSSI